MTIFTQIAPESKKATIMATTQPEIAKSSDSKEISASADDHAEQDVESLKTGATLGSDTKIGDGGARQAELMQLAWGQHGRWWIFIGLGLCMLA